MTEPRAGYIASDGDETWHPGIPMGYRDAIVTGDARELASELPDESVDLIFTDPPYPREYLHLYHWLGKIGARVLVPGGYLFAYGAVDHLPLELHLLGAYGLDYFWVDVLLHNGACPRMWAKRLMSGYKPIMVFTKGHPARLPWRITVYSDRMEKNFHPWQQGRWYPMKMIEMLTDAGDVILDPFCGGGTIPVVCETLGRHYIAFEIDPDTAARARERVANVQPPLFIADPADQPDMFEVCEL